MFGTLHHLKAYRSGIGVSSLALLASLGSGCISAPEEPRDGFLVGALLPYTGGLAASGANMEEALILAAEQINQAGGIAGQQVHVIVRDSGRSTADGIAEARDLIDNVGIKALIGPESPGLLTELQPLLSEKHVVQIVAGTTAPPENGSSSQLTFRLIPSVLSMASAVAQKLVTDGVSSVAIAYQNDGYGQGFSNLFTEQFTKRSGTVVGTVPIADDGSYSSALVTELSKTTGSVVLVAYPESAPQIVEDWWVRNSQVRWYVAPPLKTPAFVENTSPNIVEGMTGVSPALAEDANLFTNKFESRWAGDYPIAEAYFYFDALILASLGAAAGATPAGLPSGEALHQSMVNVSPGPGFVGATQVEWFNVSQGLQLIEAGTAIDFRGVTGLHDLRQTGTATSDLIQLWDITSGNIVDQSLLFASPKK